MSLPDISKLSGLSINGVNLWGDHKSIEAAMRWEHSHATIGDVRTNLSHFRDNLTEAVMALMAAELVLSHTGHEGSLVLMQVRAVIAKAGAA